MDLDWEDDICADNLFLFHKGVHTTLTGVHPLGDDGDGVLGGLIDGEAGEARLVGVLGGPTGAIVRLDGGVVGMMMLATPGWWWTTSWSCARPWGWSSC